MGHSSYVLSVTGQDENMKSFVFVMLLSATPLVAAQVPDTAVEGEPEPVLAAVPGQPDQYPYTCQPIFLASDKPYIQFLESPITEQKCRRIGKSPHGNIGFWACWVQALVQCPLDVGE